jgi:hypothetical protein
MPRLRMRGEVAHMCPLNSIYLKTGTTFPLSELLLRYVNILCVIVVHVSMYGNLTILVSADLMRLDAGIHQLVFPCDVVLSPA